MTDHDTVPPVGGQDKNDSEICRQVGLILDMDIPAPCVAGVAMNTRLLADHIAVMRRGRGVGQ